MFKNQPVNKKYVSSIDKALNEFNQTHALSPAQQAEKNKYSRIYRLRDHATPPPKKDKNLWDFEG